MVWYLALVQQQICCEYLNLTWITWQQSIGAPGWLNSKQTSRVDMQLHETICTISEQFDLLLQTCLELNKLTSRQPAIVTTIALVEEDF